MMLFCSVHMSAHDFEYEGFYYNITTFNDETVTISLTFRGSSPDEYPNEYSGNGGILTIPGTVIYNKIKYPVTVIGEGAFKGCSGLTQITIPNSVTSIDYGAFEGCSGLTQITIPNSVTEIGNSAFHGCSSLTEVTIPDSVTEIGNSAFHGCSSLTSIVVENENSVYDSRDNCNAIIETATNTLIAGCQSSIIPSSVINIGGWAFASCSGLTEITIPDTVRKISDWAFAGCYGLTEITIGNSVTTIGKYIFSGCSNLSKIVVESSNSVYNSRWNCNAIIETATNTIIAGCKNTTFPFSSMNPGYIGDYAFAGCYGLTEITIPSTVERIGTGAFNNMVLGGIEIVS